MDTAKVSTTLSNVKSLANEVSAQEGRLSFVKNEVANLTRQRDLMKQEVSDMQAVIAQDAAQKLDAIKKEQQKLAETKNSLDAKHKEVFEMTIALRDEKTAFAKEKAEVLGAKEAYAKMNEDVGNFVRMVKRGAEAL